MIVEVGLVIVMVSKIHNQKGITLVEVMAVITIMGIFFTAAILILNPPERRADARDNRRLSDIALLDRVISEYLLDHGAYPDTAALVRTSITLPDAQSVSLDNPTAGWIDTDLSKYTQRMPLDPLNTNIYKYEYTHDATTYELNAVLESQVDFMLNDGGDNSSKYEMGNNLLLIN